MLLFIILLLIAIILMVVFVLVVSAVGAGAILIFGDVIVCIVLIGFISYKLIKRKM